MQKITSHLWFDKEARDAARLYTSLFPESRVVSDVKIGGTPSGDVDIIIIDLPGQEFTLINAGPYFTKNPSISYMVLCETKDEVDRLWALLSPGGKALMELGEYPFSPRYGWIEDKYGLSWQLLFMEGATGMQKIRPSLLFTKEMAGKAEEAVRFYVSLFPNAKVQDELVARYKEGMEPDKPGTLQYGPFTLGGQSFVAMDSAQAHDFVFNEGVSFMVYCDDQKEIDHYWESFTRDGGEESMCGWLKDKYGVSWQIVPKDMDRMMQSEDKAAVARVTEAFLQMKKFDLVKLEAAFQGD